MKLQTVLLISFLILTAMPDTSANITLPAIFGDHMVLQQQSLVPIWGWGKSGEVVTINCSWDATQVYKQTIDNQGQWKISLQTPEAGGPYSIVIQGYNTIHLSDVLLGEVWLCSGQSNMEWTPRSGIDNADEESKMADFPEIRFFTVQQMTATTPQNNFQGRWVKCTPSTMFDFSAVGFYFGKALQDAMHLPIGLIASAWGGTPAEAWMPEDTILHDDYLHSAADRLEEVPWGPTESARIFNAMIHPMIPYKLAGVIWYQGEANTGFPEAYTKTLPALIDSWRKAWDDAFAFYYAQIAPYAYDWTYQGGLLRDAQRRAMILPGTGMVVTSDIGNPEDIHPKNKKDVGKRLALWALHHDYGFTELEYSGPLFKSVSFERGKARISFSHVDGGLVCKGEKLTHFEIAGEDRTFFAARATIDGEQVVVQSDAVPKPVAVRFALGNTDEPNLFNAAGLPASCFRTDDWPVEIRQVNK